MKYILTLSLIIFLQGCVLFKNHNPPIIPPETVVHLSPEALVTCDFLKEEIVLTSFEGVLLAYSEVATQYSICASKQSSSIKLLKQFGNIK